MSADMLTVADVAIRLQVSRMTVYRRIAAAEISTTNIAERGKRPRLRVSEGAFSAYLKARTKTSRRVA